jgi:hypothetical protein
MRPAPPLASFSISSINREVHFPLSSAIPSQVADRINLFDSDIVPIPVVLNNVFILSPPKELHVAPIIPHCRKFNVLHYSFGFSSCIPLTTAKPYAYHLLKD